jgi:hypothetical protein
MSTEVFNRALSAALAAAEPGSAYTLDCFVTSEVGHNDLLTRCQAVKPGGAYIGVGPCQNFTYIGALRPSHAVIFDARLDNLIEHLIFKAAFERAATPREYLAFLFSRDLPDVRSADVHELLAAFDSAQTSARLFEANCEALLSELGSRWALPEAMLARARHIFSEFHRRGLAITSVSEEQLKTLDYIPDLRTVIASSAYTGEHLHYLASAESYAHVRDLQRSDRIILVLGNIAGGASAASINDVLDDLGVSARALYLSNLEEFLLGRYEIEQSGVTRRPNPAGLLTGSWKTHYADLVRTLREIRSAEDCLLIRYFFPGEHADYHHGTFPWLAGNMMPLQKFLTRYETETPASVFDTYW